MITQPPPMFDHADRHEHELTDRQREVLRLLAAGRTNAEIAEELRVTFDGAKWNVSEVLTKLGLDTREEAAAYYRWRNRMHQRIGRRLLGLLPFAPVKTGIAAGAAGTLAVAGVVAFAVLGAAQPAAADDDQPFYLEARLEQHTRAVVYEPGAPPRDEWSDTTWQTRWWWDDATHQRAEASVVAPDTVSFADVVVADGTDLYRQVGAEPYWRTPITADNPPRSVASHAPTLGPSDADSVDDLVAEYARQGHARRAGTDEVLGREVVVVEFGPTGFVMGPDGRWVEDGSGRIWVDPERMFVMRFEAGGNATVRAEVTALRYGEDQPNDVFAFAPLPGTGENSCNGDGGTVPPGFLAVPASQVPAGMTVRPYSVSADTEGGQAVCQSLRTIVQGETPGPGFIAVAEDREHPALLLPIERDDARTLAGGVTAYARQQGGTLVSLAWVADGLGVELRSDILSMDELAAFANAMLAP